MNVLSVALDESLDVAGFLHEGATVGPRLGARRIGASVYEALTDAPIWPYHYHHGSEEWLYVVAGAPVLREPAGRRQLTVGDLVCFPSGHAGAHTVTGPGRFVILSTGEHVGPYLTVYPDSDKLSGPGGILLRSSAVGYWYGEGTYGSAGRAEPTREPEFSPPQPVVNVLTASAPGSTTLGAIELSGTVVDLHPSEHGEPYHYAFGRETWVLVLAGSPTLRRPDGEHALEAGDLACFPEGPAGAHELLNRGSSPARVLVVSTTGLPVNVHYPDSGRWEMHNQR